MSETSTANAEVGELTVQYVAEGKAAREELDEFRREVSAKIAGLEHADAVLETFSFPEFDGRLFHGGDDE